jgi:hypothetical protein
MTSDDATGDGLFDPAKTKPESLGRMIVENGQCCQTFCIIMTIRQCRGVNRRVGLAPLAEHKFDGGHTVGSIR